MSDFHKEFREQVEAKYPDIDLLYAKAEAIFAEYDLELIIHDVEVEVINKYTTKYLIHIHFPEEASYDMTLALVEDGWTLPTWFSNSSICYLEKKETVNTALLALEDDVFQIEELAESIRKDIAEHTKYSLTHSDDVMTSAKLLERKFAENYISLVCNGDVGDEYRQDATSIGNMSKLYIESIPELPLPISLRYGIRVEDAK